MTLTHANDLLQRLAPVARLDGERLVVDDPARFRSESVDPLVFDAVFAADASRRDVARWLIWAASQELGCPSASIHDLYMARGRGQFDGFTVPAINVRATTYLTAQQAFLAAQERDAGAVVFEIAKSEMSYTDQRPAEYTAAILSAALKVAWKGPVFLQGDHFQFNATKWATDPEGELRGIGDLTREAIAAGFLNIDIDSSTLVDLSRSSVAEQQATNARNTAELTRLIRSLQPSGVMISVGGEIGEVGKNNSTEEELRAYLEGYHADLGDDAGPGISKVSIQTGTSHGGVPLPDGTVAEVKIDFDTLGRLSRVAREEFGLAGCVQHGASTLPEEAFHHFPANGAAEIHLATGFQNILYDEPGLPPALRAEMMAWCRDNLADERKDGETEEQFLYKTRKKALGPFKRDLWTLPEDAQERIGANLRARFGVLFDELRIAGSADVVRRFVRPAAVAMPLPAGLGGGEREMATAGASVFEDDGSGE